MQEFKLRNRLLAKFLVIWLCVGCALPALRAAPADDDYTLGITLYGQKRWDLAAETLRGYLQKYPDHANVPLAKLYLAQSYVNLRKYTEARVELREFLKQFPQNKNLAQAMYRVAECSYFLDDFPAAIEEFNAFLKQAPSDALSEWALPYLADSHLRNNQPAEAARVFQQSLEKFPQGRFVEDSRFGLARAYELQNQPRGAIEAYRELINLQGGKRAPEAMINLGMLHFQLQEYTDAAGIFTSLVEKYPASSLVPLAELNAGYAQYSLRQWDEAIKHFQKAEQSPAYHASAKFWHALTLKSQELHAEAGKLLAELQAGELPEDLQPRVTYQLADSRFLQGNYADALAGYDTYLKRWPQGEQAEAAWLHAVESELLSGRLQEGWMRAESPGGVTLSPAAQRERVLLQARLLTAPAGGASELPAALGDRANRLKTAGELLAPWLAALTATETDLVSQQIRYLSAQLAQEQKRPEDAIELLEPITAKLPTGGVTRIPEAWLLLAGAYLEREQYELALEATEKFPADAQASRVLELNLLRLNCLMSLQRLAEAEQALGRLAEAKLDDNRWIQAAYQLADASYERADWPRATALYEAILARNPPPEWTIRAMSGLGWAQYEAGQFAQSSQTFNKLQEAYPESRQAAADAGYMRAMAELKAGRNEQAAQIFFETAEQFQSPAEQLQGDDIHHIAYRCAREAARSYRQLGNIERSSAAYRLAHRELGKQPRERQQNLDKLLDEWALLHYESSQFDEADAIFRLLIEARPDSDRADDARLSLAESAYVAGKLAEARKMLEALLTLPGADEYVKRRARYQLVLIAAEQKDLPAVLKHAREYLTEIDPQQVELAERGEVESQLIQYYLETDQLPDASRELDSLLKRVEGLDPSEPPAWLPGLFVQAAELARRVKQYDKARQWLATVETRFPNTPEHDQIEVIAGRTYIAEANFDLARKSFQAVLDRAAGKKSLAAAQSQFYLAETALMKKEYETALKEYIRMAVLFPGFPELQTASLFQAGQCDEALGNVEQAIQSYENLLRQFPENEFASKAKERIEKLRGKK
ncbi:MAG: tetratricopeptide repeat protein [Planctomycetaceae bacterium]|nr:tetratricopeptide repeat protein [Planctomycetaceae bacterium]